MADPEKGQQQSTPAAGDSSEASHPTPSPQVTAASRRFQQTQAQVDEVVGIMRTNVEKVLERDTKLSELVSRLLLHDILHPIPSSAAVALRHRLSARGESPSCCTIGCLSLLISLSLFYLLSFLRRIPLSRVTC